MANKFKAMVVDKVDGEITAEFRELSVSDLPEHDVLVDIAYSSLNYKDGLAITGDAPICRKMPMVCGIDLAGTVETSSSNRFKPGDKVLVNGWGLSETQWGGYSKKQRLQSEWLLPVPETFSLKETMAIGTAGYTAMLCVMALEEGGLSSASGPIIVTGAGGGVGSSAVSLLSSLGYEVLASTGREETKQFLLDLGASGIIAREELAERGKPFGKERWAGAVDCVGGQTLANVLAQTSYGGTVAACGLAGGSDLPATVLPFILRDIRLDGVDSVMTPYEKREHAWHRLSKDLDRAKLEKIMSVEPMSMLPELASKIVRGGIRGRTVIDVAN